MAGQGYTILEIGGKSSSSSVDLRDASFIQFRASESLEFSSRPATQNSRLA